MKKPPIRRFCVGMSHGTLIAVCALVLQATAEFFGLLDPVLHLAHSGQRFDELLFVVGFFERFTQVFWIALRELWHGVYACDFEQVPVFLTNAVEIGRASCRERP